MPKVLMAASEAAPFSKTGGLADVIGSLPRALAAQGVEVAVLTPFHRQTQIEAADAPRVYEGMRVWLGSSHFDANIRCFERNGVSWYFVEHPLLFDRAQLYGEPDDHIRFAVFCHSALGVIRHLFRPHILHLHDWLTGLIPPLIRRQFGSDPTFFGMKILYTIHNLGYQGIFGRNTLGELGLDPSLFHPGALEFWGDVNWMKGGIVFSDFISTVSPTYAQEIQTPEFGFGLDDLIRARSNELAGILNGVDYSEWSPERDRFIKARYSVEDLAGKRENKRDLLIELGLPEENMERPLFGIVSRFAPQKGFDLIRDVAGELMSENAALAVLGSGEPEYEDMFRRLEAAFPERVAVRFGFDNALAHKIEAGADMFLMPSKYEPCGLNQIYSLRYGSPPIVRATGGLDDTIDVETGFKFRNYSGAALMEAVRSALAAWKDRVRWSAMMRQGMQKDFSWDASAAAYSELYQRLQRRD